MKRAVLLVNMGGPSSAAEVEPYLHAIFRDPAILPLPSFARPSLARLIARRRAPKVRERYALLGGASPLGRLTDELARGARALLPDDVDIAYAFRYVRPTLEEALTALAGRGVKDVRLLPLFPHHTAAMTGSIVNEARRVGIGLGTALEVVPAWGGRRDIVGLWSAMVRDALTAAGSGARVLFTAHGIPMRNVRRGDDYPASVADSARAVGDELPEGTSWSLAYQSRVGPVAWTEPYLEDEIARLGRLGSEPVVIVPLSFAADCLETLYDLDIVARELLGKAGITGVVRVAAFNASPAFARIVADMATEPLEVAA